MAAYRRLLVLLLQSLPLFLACDVEIESIAASDNGQTLVITATNTNTAENIFQYPGFRVSIAGDDDNMPFGESDMFYMGITGGDAQFDIASTSTSSIVPLVDIALHIELWTWDYQQKECEWDWEGAPEIYSSPAHNNKQARDSNALIRLLHAHEEIPQHHSQLYPNQLNNE